MTARRSATVMAILLVAAAASLSAVFGCPDSSNARLHVSFADEPLRARAAIVQVNVYRGGCDGSESVYDAEVLRGASDPGPGPLEAGVYGFSARAGDAECVYFAEGCVVRTLPLDTDDVIEIILRASEEEEAYCDYEGGICNDGLCVPETSDADVDSDTEVRPETPSLLSPHNGWSTGSVHATQRIGEHAPLRPTFRWTAVDGADRYQIQVDDGCDASQPETCEWVVVEFPDETSDTHTRPDIDLPVEITAPVGRRYAWRVRACSGSACSDWTAPWYVNVGRLPNDYNGDGYSDVVISAPGYAGAVEKQGAVYVFYGSEEGFDYENRDRLEESTTSEASQFGWSVAPAGDVDADGYADLIVGTRSADHVVLYRGGPNGLGPSTPQPIEGVTGTRFGYWVAGIGDLDADGHADVAIGAPRPAQDGQVFIFRGNEQGLEEPPIAREPQPG